MLTCPCLVSGDDDALLLRFDPYRLAGSVHLPSKGHDIDGVSRASRQLDQTRCVLGSPGLPYGWGVDAELFEQFDNCLWGSVKALSKTVLLAGISPGWNVPVIPPDSGDELGWCLRSHEPNVALIAGD